jgi:hemoglobin
MATDTGHLHAQDQTDYDRIGGGPAIRAVVDRFYELVLGDGRLSGYFAGTDVTQLKRHQVLLISQVTGGPAQYDGRDLQQAHAALDITGEDFALVVSYLAQALEEAGVPAEIIGRVGAQLAATKRDIVAAGAP